MTTRSDKSEPSMGHTARQSAAARRTDSRAMTEAQGNAVKRAVRVTVVRARRGGVVSGWGSQARWRGALPRAGAVTASSSVETECTV